MEGKYRLSFEYLISLIEGQKDKKIEQEKVIARMKEELEESDVSFQEWESLRVQMPTWKEVFLEADNATKRVLVNKIIDKIYVKKEEVVIRFKIDLRDIRSKAFRKIGEEMFQEKKTVILDNLRINPKDSNE